MVFPSAILNDYTWAKYPEKEYGFTPDIKSERTLSIYALKVTMSLAMNNTTTSCSFSDSQNRSIVITYGSVGALAVIICIVGLFLAFFLKLYSKFVYRLAMYQVTAALFIGLARSMQLPLMAVNDNETNHKLCVGLAYIIVSIDWIKLVFTVWITVHLFTYAVFCKNLKRLEIPLVVIGLIVGPSIASVPLATHAYGRAGAWCWITNRNQSCPSESFPTGEIEQFAIWFVPAIVILIINSVLGAITVATMGYRICCAKGVRKVQHNIENEERTALVERKEPQTLRDALIMLLPLIAYPFIYCILLITPLVNRFYQLAAHQTNSKLFLASAALIPSVSLSVSIAFLTHIAVVERMTLLKFLCACKRTKQLGLNADENNETVVPHHHHTVSTAGSTKFDIIRESELDNQQEAQEHGNNA